MEALTEHFTLDELIASDTARQRGIDNTPSATIVGNLQRIAQTLEQIRAVLGGLPLVVTSGYRSAELNRTVGGVTASAHLSGLAADFVCPQYGVPLKICHAIAGSGIEFDQLIQEGAWVHVGLAAASDPPRRQVLTVAFDGARTTYEENL